MANVQLVARSKEDILAARGVKPTLSPNLNTLATVEALDVKRLLFIGVGCQARCLLLTPFSLRLGCRAPGLLVQLMRQCCDATKLQLVQGAGHVQCKCNRHTYIVLPVKKPQMEYLSFKECGLPAAAIGAGAALSGEVPQPGQALCAGHQLRG